MAQPKKTIPDFTIYSWVGLCIKRWAYAESHMYGICRSALGMNERPRRALAAVIFFRTPSIEARMTLISDLLQAVAFPDGKKSGQHDPEFLKKWRKVEALMRELTPFRNFIAHNPMQRRHASVLVDGEKMGIYRRGELEIVQEYDDRIRRKSSIEKVGVAELKAHSKAMDDVMSGLLEAWRALEETLEESD